MIVFKYHILLTVLKQKVHLKQMGIQWEDRNFLGKLNNYSSLYMVSVLPFMMPQIYAQRERAELLRAAPFHVSFVYCGTQREHAPS